MIAFVCAMQVEAFRRMHGNAFATTMCTGNLRSGTELLSVGMLKKEKEKIRSGLSYYWIDLVFVVGAATGALICSRFGERSIWLCCTTLLSALGFIRHEKKNAEV